MKKVLIFILGFIGLGLISLTFTWTIPTTGPKLIVVTPSTSQLEELKKGDSKLGIEFNRIEPLIGNTSYLYLRTLPIFPKLEVPVEDYLNTLGIIHEETNK